MWTSVHVIFIIIWEYKRVICPLLVHQPSHWNREVSASVSAAWRNSAVWLEYCWVCAFHINLTNGFSVRHNIWCITHISVAGLGLTLVKLSTTEVLTKILQILVHKLIPPMKHQRSPSYVNNLTTWQWLWPISCQSNLNSTQMVRAPSQSHFSTLDSFHLQQNSDAAWARIIYKWTVEPGRVQVPYIHLSNAFMGIEVATAGWPSASSAARNWLGILVASEAPFHVPVSYVFLFSFLSFCQSHSLLIFLFWCVLTDSWECCRGEGEKK